MAKAGKKDGNLIVSAKLQKSCPKKGQTLASFFMKSPSPGAKGASEWMSESKSKRTEENIHILIYIYIYATGIKTSSDLCGRPAVFGLPVLGCMCLCFCFVGVCLRMLAREILRFKRLCC